MGVSQYPAINYCLIAATLFFSGCSVVPNGVYDENHLAAGGGRRLVIWMLSDIQPPDDAGRVVFEEAVRDVSVNIPDVDLAVIAGDLLRSRSQAEAFEWFNATRELSYIKDWYEIAGNHDVRSGDIFWQYISKPAHYGVRIGNVLLLLLSDESTDSKTDISKTTFNWWQEAVKANQDDIIITVTHASLRRSGLFTSFIKSRRIDGSGRFERVLKHEKVAIWASGHSHLPQGMAGTVSIEPALGGTFFVNVSAIRDDTFMDSQSRFVIFEEGSDIVWIRSRNHTQQRYEPGLDIPLRLDKPFVWDGAGPELLINP